MMRTNKTKAKLEAGGVVYGAIISEASPSLVELFGAMGYDFVMLDGEHGSMEPTAVEHMVRAAEVFDITPLARVPDHQASTLLRFLDRGVQGVIVPHVNTAAQAQAVVEAARYGPLGKRGLAGGRAHDYNISVRQPDSTAWVNANTLVIPMIEEVEAVSNLDAILAVPGVDVLHVASNDLSQSMGHPGADAVRQEMHRVVTKIAAAGKPAGVGGNAPTDHEGIATMIGLGARFVTIQAFGLVRVGAEQFKGGIEAALAKRKA